MILPVLLIFGGAAALLVLVLKTDDDFGPVPEHGPDSQAPGSTGYRRIDAILSKLRQAAESSGIPLGVLVGWIAKESGGRLDEVTRFGERGLFQLMPAESSALGLDHPRLSTDVDYSISAGVALIKRYAAMVEHLGIASAGSDFYWKLVKLVHTIGWGATSIVVAAAKAAGSASTWTRLEGYALSHQGELLSSTKHSMVKWFPLVDAVAKVGEPFGFGAGGTMLVGAAVSDVDDPLDCL